MSNHCHLVLFVNQDELNCWSDDEVMERWGSLFPASTLKKRAAQGAFGKGALKARRYWMKKPCYRAWLTLISIRYGPKWP